MRPASSKTLGVIAVVLCLAAVAAWLVVKRPDRVDLSRYAPESAMLFVQVNSIPDLAEALASSDGWRRLAPPLGLDRELRLAGPLADALGRAGIGHDEAVALGRAQLGVVVTGVEATAQSAGDGVEEASVVVRPRFALLVETHLSERTVDPIVRERLPELARRAFGDSVAFEAAPYAGTEITTARAPGGERQMAWTVSGSLVVIANDGEPVRAVLDAQAGRTPSLAGNFYLTKVRPAVRSDDALIFAFVSQSGVGRLVGLAPGAIAGTLTADPDRATTVAKLFATMSERTVAAIGYSGRFDQERFLDRYFALPAPGLGEALSTAVRPPPRADEIAALVPPEIAQATVLRVERPGDAYEQVLAAVSHRVDVSVSATLSQIGIELRRHYGVVADDPIGPALGDELALLDFGDGSPVVNVVAVRDESRLLGTIGRYLRAGGSRLVSDSQGGVEVLRSTHEDGRAAAFIGRYLVLGTSAQIGRMAAVRHAGGGSDALRALLRADPPPVLMSISDDRATTTEFCVALARALGSEGAAWPAAAEAALPALAGLAPATSTTTLRDGGLLVESRSQIGALSYLTLFL